MRENLDAFDDFSDEEIWSVLSEVQMDKKVNEFPLKLYEVISESNNVFSVG